MLAALLPHLNGWAFDRAIWAKHAAISFLWFEYCFASLTFIEEGTCVLWHGLFFRKTTFRAGNGGFELYYLHNVCKITTYWPDIILWFISCGVSNPHPQTLKAVMVTIAFNPQKKPTLPNNIPSWPTLWYSQANHCFRGSLLPVLSLSASRYLLNAPKFHHQHHKAYFFIIVPIFGNFFDESDFLGIFYGSGFWNFSCLLLIFKVFI